MFRFENSIFLWGLLIIPILAGIFYLLRIKRNKLLQKYGDLSLIVKLFPESSNSMAWIKFSFILAGLFFIIIGLANPQIGTKLIEAKSSGVDVIVALDVSNSMLCEDLKPNRLERSKQMLYRLIDKLKGDRIGLIVFAGEPFIQLPMTSDYSAAKMFVNTITTDLMPTQGTAIGSAIDMGVEFFNFEKDKQKALIVITDGENHEDDAIASAKKAKENNFTVFTIGMGSISGGPIPIFSNGNRSGFIKDEEGNVVVTKLNDQALLEIATAGNGKFIRSSDTEPDLSELLKELSGMQKTDFKDKVFSDYDDKYYYFIGFGVLLLILELLISEKKLKFIQRIEFLK
jgi:Ca-activated chloride channel family protein